MRVINFQSIFTKSGQSNLVLVLVLVFVLESKGPYYHVDGNKREERLEEEGKHGHLKIKSNSC